MDIQVLERVGFTKGEIRVYFALLELGQTTTGPIIDRSGVSSSKVYEIVEKLIQKGLVSYTTRKKTKYYQAASPKKIKEYLEKEKRKLEASELQIDLLIPVLEKKQKESELQQTSAVYEGFEGIKTVFTRILDALEKGDEYYVFMMDEAAESEELRLFLLNHHAKRVDRKVKVKILSKNEKKSRIKKMYPAYKYSERRFIDHAFPTGVYIFKDNVMHFTYKPKPTLVVVTSKQNYESYKKFFLDMWAHAKT